MEAFLCHAQQVGGGNAQQVGAHLLEGVYVVVAEVGLSDALHLVQAVVVVDRHLSDHLALGCPQLPFAEGVGCDVGQLVADELAGFVLCIKVHAGVDIEETGIGEWHILRLDIVAETVVLAHGHVET